MKSFLIALIMTVMSLPAYADNTASNNNPIQTFPAEEENLLDDKIYFFVHSMCQNCREAFIYIYGQHQDLNIPITDMKFRHNFELYKQCVQKFNIANNQLRLPLICMGNHYIMGWDGNSAAEFEKHLAQFQAETKKPEE